MPADSTARLVVVPVFPLPGTVFFPDTGLPLHVFEPRYRAMVRDAADGDRRIAVSLLTPGYEKDYHAMPGFHRVGTVGRIDELVQLPDGRFDMRLVGLERVVLDPRPSEHLYQVAHARPRPEQQPPGEAGLERSKLDLLATHGLLMRELADDGGTNLVLDDRITFVAAVNQVCASVPVDARLRQQLLEEDDFRLRAERASTLLQDVLETVLRMKSLRGTGAEPDEVN